MSEHSRGYLITGTGVLILSPDALLIRLLGDAPWNILFWRGLGFALVVLLVVVARYGRRLPAACRAVGAPGLVVAPLFGLGTIFFLLSITHTSVANTLVIISTSPLFAALLSFVLMGEMLALSTALAIMAGLFGVVITVWGSLGAGRLLGDFAALATAICMALNFSLIRRARGRDLMPVYALSGLLITFAALPFAEPLAFAGRQWLWLALLVLLVHPVAFLLITLGPRYLTAPEVSLLMLMETVLGPLWVWLALGERPPSSTLLGGAVILAALAANAAWRLRVSRALPRPGMVGGRDPGGA